MTINDRITKAAWKAARKEIGVPTTSGMCLSLVRRVVEHALFGGDYQFYDRYLVSPTSRREGADVGNHRRDPWAIDLEASVKTLGYAVPLDEREPGDLIFNHNTVGKWGHVGVLVDASTVLENIKPYLRPGSIHLGTFLSLTPIQDFKPTLLARIKEIK